MIVASSSGRVIGNNNKLPWHISEELKYFKAMTNGGVVVMGRKTFENLPKPLAGRTNLVFTRGDVDISKWCGQGYDIQKTSIFDYIQERYPSKDIWIAGGKTIYEQALEQNLPERLYISNVYGDYEGDIYFPKIPDCYDLVDIINKETFCIKKYISKVKLAPSKV